MKQKIKIILIVILSLLFLFIGGIVLFLLILPDDIPPANDSHLIRPIENIPDEKNAFSFYSKAVSALQYPEGDELFDKIVEGEKWDEELVQKVLKENSEVFAFIDKGNLCERCIVPRATSPETPLPYLRPWRSVARLYSVKISSNIRNKKGDEALENVISLNKFIHNTEKDAGCLMNYLVSIAIQDICMKSTCELIWSRLLNDNQLTRLQNVLISHQPSTQGYILAWKTEYEIFANTVDELYAGDRLLDGGLTFSKANFLQNCYVKCFLHPNRTKHEGSLIYSEMIDQAGNSLADSEFTDTNKFVMDRKIAYEAKEGSDALRTPNPLGIVVHKILLPITGGAVESKCRMEALYRSTLLITAIHRFKKANKTLPKNLDELVPKYLPEIPLDPFDGKPMRYSLSNRVVYSVGEDLEDDGGNTHFFPIKKPRTLLEWKTKDLLLGVEKKIERN